ncbi:hypothetical protein ACDP63_11740 [Paracoccus sp. P2]|nr:hypothetical protein [Paracoccus pantotrophus]MDF3853533.1 hypothetical protein [Paracoccus pantotrophus]SFO45557.1 hypothetical protein SAMN04244567_01846 [Paracoccus pantotrophus]
MPPLFRCLILACMVLADPALASPWPRQVKEIFLALSAERDARGNGYAGLYGEYGLRRRTLGFELGRSSAGETSAMIWLQRPLGRGRGADRWALSLGSGVIERNGIYMPVGQVGAGWGRGFDAVPLLDRIPGGGWLAVEARVKVAGKLRDEAEIAQLAASGAGRLAYLTPETSVKAEVTLGWHATERLMLIGQLRLEDRQDSGFSSRLAASAVRELFGPVKLELGAIGPLSGQGEAAVKLGFWVGF